MTKTTKDRVDWTHEEETLFIDELVKNMLAEGITAVPPRDRSHQSTMYLNLLRKSQTVLPEDRRRSFIYRSVVRPGLENRIKVHLGMACHAADRIEIPATTQAPAQVPLSSPAQVPQDRQVVIVQHGRTPLADYDDLEIMTEYVKRVNKLSTAATLATDIITKAETRLSAVEDKIRQLEEYDRLITDELASVGRREIKLAQPIQLQKSEDKSTIRPFVVGMLGFKSNDFQAIIDRFDGVPGIEFKFIDCTKKPHAIVATDIVVTTRFINHTWTDCNRHLVHSNKMFWANGGRVSAVDAIVAAVTAERPDIASTVS